MKRRDSELKKLVEEQKKDKKSFVVFPRVTHTPFYNELSFARISEITCILQSAGLSDMEQLCFVAKHVLGWSKLHFSKTMKAMGQSHTAINNHLKCAGEKIARVIQENEASKPRNNKTNEVKPVTDKEEIDDIFQEYSDHERQWRKKNRKTFNKKDDN